MESCQKLSYRLCLVLFAAGLRDIGKKWWLKALPAALNGRLGTPAPWNGSGFDVEVVGPMEGISIAYSQGTPDTDIKYAHR